MANVLVQLPTQLTSLLQLLQNEPVVISGLNGLAGQGRQLADKYSETMQTNGGHILSLIFAMTNAQTPDTCDLAELSNRLLTTATELRSVKADVVTMQADIHREIETCRARKMANEAEIAGKVATLQQVQGEIDGLNEQIGKWNSDANELDTAAAQLDGRANDLRRAAKKKRKRGLLGGIVGIVLAPFTGGLSLVAGAAVAGVNVNDADSCSDKARNIRSDASKKREDANNLRTQVQTLQEQRQNAQLEVDRMNCRRDELTTTIATLGDVTSLLISAVPVLDEIITNLQFWGCLFMYCNSRYNIQRLRINGITMRRRRVIDLDFESALKDARMKGEAIQTIQMALKNNPQQTCSRFKPYVDRLKVTWNTLEHIFRSNGIIAVKG